jgi:hypothetical protein
MTRGRGGASRKQEPFFITLGGPKAHDSSVEKHSQESAAEPQVPPLRCAPVGMTRGRGGASRKQEPFSSPWVAEGP